MQFVKQVNEILQDIASANAQLLTYEARVSPVFVAIQTFAPKGICRFALGFCKNIKKKTETLIQGFSPFMGNDSKTNTISGYRFAITLSFCNGCIWCKNSSVGATPDFRFFSLFAYFHVRIFQFLSQ